MKRISGMFLVALLSGATTLGAYKVMFDNDTPSSTLSVAPSSNFTRTVGLGAESVDFTAAADKAVHTVVHVKNVTYSTGPRTIAEFIYGYRGGEPQPQIG